jgi:hypothetical protein
MGSTDELQKSAAYMTEAYLLSQAKSLRTPFEYAFGTSVGFFEWLEGEEGQEKVMPKRNRSRQRFILSRSRYDTYPSVLFQFQRRTWS